jgi:hypothetical protein
VSERAHLRRRARTLGVDGRHASPLTTPWGVTRTAARGVSLFSAAVMLARRAAPRKEVSRTRGSDPPEKGCRNMQRKDLHNPYRGRTDRP